MHNIDTTLFVFLMIFACIGLLLSWVHFLNFAFSLGRKKAAKEAEKERMNDILEKILKKIDEK